ncbi:DUF4097 family beta strand repeat-containing protein [Lactobacillus sp. PSON]|uniref:DUF4097 family beta strand repeat-containing protein n=1 Tax=Lactobacillus sp. PSON TaxID=3455454 RepID=UPI0040422AAD
MVHAKTRRITDEDIIKKSLTTESFDSLNIRLLSSDIRIENGDRFEVIYKGIKEEMPKVELVGDIMNIEQNNREEINVTYDLNHRYDLGVKVTIPREAQIDKLNFSSIEGDFKLRKLIVANMYIKSSSGDVDLEDSNIKSGEIYVLDGDFKADNTDLDNVAIQLDDGDAYMKRMNLTGGSINLIDGDCRIWDSKFNGKYFIRNSDGDNKVEGVMGDGYGYSLDTLDGTNKLFKETRQGHLELNTQFDNFITMKTMKGDNIVK